MNFMEPCDLRDAKIQLESENNAYSKIHYATLNNIQGQSKGSFLTVKSFPLQKLARPVELTNLWMGHHKQTL